jgi:hypothetical protein
MGLGGLSKSVAILLSSTVSGFYNIIVFTILFSNASCKEINPL